MSREQAPDNARARHSDTGNGEPENIDPEDIARFESMAARWWDPEGPFRPLHRFNPARLTVIRDRLAARFDRDPHRPRCLEGVRILDIGTGGGLIAEPLARLGAEVTGIDPAEGNIAAARHHAGEQGLAITYRVCTAETLVAEGRTYDAVLALEVVEHVPDPAAFLQTAAQLVAPSGLLIAATLNRTFRAFLLAIVGAEYVLGWLPRGTHDWNRFLTPHELARMLKAAGLTPGTAEGLSYNPLTSGHAGGWSVGRDLGVNYVLAATRDG